MAEYTSPNCDRRAEGTEIDTLVLHYTGMKSGQEALEWLCNPESKVSSHYFIDEDGTTHELVPCEHRAWHAGISRWCGEEGLNNNSIGIEVVNPGHEFGYRKFPEVQMESVIKLCKKLVNQYKIAPQKVVAHSDIACDRKQDPGELFDWKLLADNGVGLWVDEEIENPELLFKKGDEGDEVKDLQTKLARYGYGIITDGIFEVKTEFVVAAFQRHFAGSQPISGIWDSNSELKINRLLDLI